MHPACTSRNGADHRESELVLDSVDACGPCCGKLCHSAAAASRGLPRDEQLRSRPGNDQVAGMPTRSTKMGQFDEGI